jgi:hypothetical protein
MDENILKWYEETLRNLIVRDENGEPPTSIDATARKVAIFLTSLIEDMAASPTASTTLEIIRSRDGGHRFLLLGRPVGDDEYTIHACVFPEIEKLSSDDAYLLDYLSSVIGLGVVNHCREEIVQSAMSVRALERYRVVYYEDWDGVVSEYAESANKPS